ncbi:cytochrome c biogenesis protein transmembrane region [Sulfobacillus acidophilus DSM 10332]|uniref:Cytochrome c biogenesis protein transmembrane region n=1 Tax=Sulfobacillus acidophilus (strain ATCC 700253 / DSM 10332 / NAL) TaxID=679936 RepID=G8TYK1_SULAD|nr:cytochrome c biogenesis protein transmembrane region [Sulfobacillus acidophilus DSM 10332]
MSVASFSIAFGAGLASVLSPCVVPLIPSYLTAMAGTSLTSEAVLSHSVRQRVITNALIFIAGFSTILVLSGLLATGIGQFVRHYQTLISQLGGLVMIIFGLEIMGLIHVGFMRRDVHLNVAPPRQSRWSAYIMGLVFAAGWTPCVGPIWGSIIILASRSTTVWTGGVLLAAYALGLAVPFFILAVFVGQATHWTRRLGRYLPWIERISGALLVVLGLLLTTNWFVRLPGLF